jgi:hypothetical protein
LARLRGICEPLSRVREREGPAAEGGGKVRVFFFNSAYAWKKKEDPHPTCTG